MKKILISLLLIVTTVMSANAMSKYRASREARFLTDKMAWELDLTPMQIEDVYEINYDYFRSLVSVYSDYSREYEIRNEELRFVLTPWQWDLYVVREYFYIPVRVLSYAWSFPIYRIYRSDRFFYDAPHGYSHYRGGHAFKPEHYRARIEIHHPGGNYRPAPPRPREPRPVDRPLGDQRHDRTGNRPGGNGAGSHAQPAKPNGGGNNVQPNKPNNNGGGNVAPNRTTPNRSGSASRSQSNTRTRTESSTSTTRPTRSQNAQSAGTRSSQGSSNPRSTSSGRR